MSLLERAYARAPAPIQTLGVSFEGARLARHKYGHGFRAFLERLVARERAGPDAMRRHQEHELRALAREAYEHVPFYRQRFRDAGLTPDDVRSVEDLRKLPFATKDDLRRAPDDFRSRRLGPRDALVRHTSGTTGTPLTVYWEKRGLMRETAFAWRHRAWAGVAPRARSVHFGGKSVVPVERRKPPFWRENLLERQTYFSSYHLSEESLPAYVARVQEVAPAFVTGYPSSLHVFAEHVLRTGARLPPVKGVFTSSETLLPRQRRAIEKAFGVPVLDYYGQTELAAIVTQCERGGYHLNPDYGVVELHEGEMVCTGFINRGTVLLRYRSGDTARPGAASCPCGRDALPLLDGIEGRVDDYVLTPEGARVGRLDHVYKDLASILESQIVQTSRDALLVKVVPAESWSSAAEAALVAEIRKRVGPTMLIRVETVDRIPRSANGKFRTVVRRVPDPHERGR